ncbi:MAG: stage III sporulation protein AB [Clostridiales bacterium]|nr:stage III sporulation protein AB [Clostridiales bacterium]
MLQVGMRWSGALLVVAGATGFGSWMAGRYRRRLGELEQLRQMIYLLKGQIVYAQAPLSEALEAVGERTDGPLAELFSRVAQRIYDQKGESFDQIWQEETKRLDGRDCALAGADRKSLASLGRHLGFLDRDMQERNLLLYLEQLDLEIGRLRAQKQETCRMYTSLGVMGGLFLAVLLV